MNTEKAISEVNEATLNFREKKGTGRFEKQLINISKVLLKPGEFFKRMKNSTIRASSDFIGCRHSVDHAVRATASAKALLSNQDNEKKVWTINAHYRLEFQRYYYPLGCFLPQKNCPSVTI